MRGCRCVLWVSTEASGPGGVAAYVRLMQQSGLWRDWENRYIVSHRSGTTSQKISAFLRGTVKFVWFLGVYRPTLVHLHMASFGSFYRKATLARIARLFRVPVIIHVHGGYFPQFYKGSARPVRIAVVRTLQKAEVVITVSSRLSTDLAQIAPGARIVMVPNPARAVDAANQPTVGEAVHVIFLGDVTADKGVFTLIEAWAVVLIEVGEGPVPHLTIAGRGELSRARTRAAELGLGDYAKVVGHLGPEQVQALMRESQVFTLPSRFEGQPMAILEAMANGLCVVSTPVGGIPEMIDVSCGILVPPDDVEALAAALLGVITDRDRRAGLGEAARRRVLARFDLGVVAGQLDKLYREVSR